MPLNPEPGPAEYGARAKEFLLRTGVISEPDNENGKIFGLGDNNLAPFEPDEEMEYGFDMGNIFSGPHLTIVPEDDQALEPRCPKCGTDVGTQLNELYCPDEETDVGEIDFTEARLTCPQCQGVFRPDELKDEAGTGIFLTHRYVCFTDAGTFRKEWLTEFDRETGTPHRLVCYGYT